MYQSLKVYLTLQDDKDDWMNSRVLTFSGIDSSYALPDNIAIITLQVCVFSLKGFPYPQLYLLWGLTRRWT